MTFKEFIISRVQIFFCLVPLILIASVLFGSVYAPEQVLHYDDLLALIRTAAWCVLPTCVTYFRKEMSVSSGIPYQTLINLYLSDCVKSRRQLNISWQ